MTIRTAMLLTMLWAAQLLSSAMLRVVPAQPHAPQKSAITASNWQQNPEIISIKTIVAATDAALKSHAFKTSERRFEYCGNAQLTVTRTAHDSKGGVPWYENYSEGQDASWDFHYYYDGAGRLEVRLRHRALDQRHSRTAAHLSRRIRKTPLENR